MNIRTISDSSVAERENILVQAVSERCAANRMSVTLWLLFDTASMRNPPVRDGWIKQFKKHAKQFGKPRSVAEGAKWLAAYWDELNDH